jgi:hypothetical protein
MISGCSAGKEKMSGFPAELLGLNFSRQRRSASRSRAVLFLVKPFLLRFAIFIIVIIFS